MIENFDRAWRLKETDVGFVTDGSTGKAAETAPTRTCPDSNTVLGPIQDVANRIGGCDYLVSAGCSHKVPTDALDVPDETALNVHSSYLPCYRGLRVHRAQRANAETTGGVTVHRMTDEFDQGKIITQQRYQIGLLDTPLAIARTIGELSASLSREAILLLEARYRGREQESGGLLWIATMANGSRLRNRESSPACS